MVDGEISEVHVGAVEVCLINFTIEWVSEGTVLVVARSASNTSVVFVWEGGTISSLSLFEWGHDDVELVLESVTSASRQQQPQRPSIVGFGHVKAEFTISRNAGEDLLVKVAGWSAVEDGTREFGVLTGEGVLASLQFVVEIINFDEVVLVVVQLDEAAEVIIFGSEEYSDEGIVFLVGLDFVVDVEFLVVQPFLTGFEEEFLFVLGQLFLVHVHGVCDVEGEVFEVGLQGREFNTVYFNSWEV